MKYILKLKYVMLKPMNYAYIYEEKIEIMKWKFIVLKENFHSLPHSKNQVFQKHPL